MRTSAWASGWLAEIKSAKQTQRNETASRQAHSGSARRPCLRGGGVWDAVCNHSYYITYIQAFLFACDTLYKLEIK